MKRVKLWLHILKNKIRVIKNFRGYCVWFEKYSVVGKSEHSIEQLRRNIIVDSHVLEKGFTHDDYRAGFGKDTVKRLIYSINNEDIRRGGDAFAVKNAESVLTTYHKKNTKESYDDAALIDSYLAEVDSAVDSDSIIITTKIRKNNYEQDDFPFIASTRHSVRYYGSDCEEIDNETWKKVAQLAQSAPSACNRQATHLYVIKKREMFHKLEQMQLGCSGFGANASAFILICSDLSLYDVNEEKLPIYDSGIYTMNLLYALQTYNLYACPLNAAFIAKNSDLYKMIDIPPEYDIQGIIVVYKIPSDRKIRVAVSHRRQVADFLHIVED